MSSIIKGIIVRVGVFFALANCGAIDKVIDCSHICSKYRDCFDAQYDVTSCTSRCNTNSTNDPSYRHTADVCSACIDGASCAGATFGCGAQCTAVVP